MHLIERRAQLVGDDPIFIYNAEADQRRRAGESVINATIGALMDDEGKLAIMPTVSRAIQQMASTEWAPYAPISGERAFLDGVVADYFSQHPELARCAVAVATPGGTGAVRHALANYLDHGQAALLPHLFWGPYQMVATENERALKTYPMFTQQGSLNVEAMEVALGALLDAQGRALVIINDPCNNPTGYSMTRAEWEAVVQVLLRHARREVTLLVDTAYWRYAAKGDGTEFLSALLPLLGKVGLCFAWSASKSFTSYGLRVGALVACEPEAKERAAMQASLGFASRGTWSTGVRGGQQVIAHLLSTPELAASCNRERDVLKVMLGRRVAAFNANAKGISYPRYDGGFFVSVFHADPQGHAAKMRKEGVFVVPTPTGFRVALCSVPEADIPRLASSLKG